MKGTFCAFLPTQPVQRSSCSLSSRACESHLKGWERQGSFSARSSAPPSDWWEQIQRARAPALAMVSPTCSVVILGVRKYQHCTQLVSPSPRRAKLHWAALWFAKWVNNEQSWHSSIHKNQYAQPATASTRPSQPESGARDSLKHYGAANTELQGSVVQSSAPRSCTQPPIPSPFHIGSKAREGVADLGLGENQGH